MECWSLEDNPDAGRSREYERVIIDEAAIAPSLKSAWLEGISPTLIKTLGDAWFLSTPKGLNYFYELYKKGQDPLEPDWSSWQLPSSVNPYLPPAELERERRQKPDLVFRQEYLAEFLSADGAVFRGVNEILIHDTPLPKEHVGHVVVAGVDWGQQNDFTAISVFCASCKREIYLDRFNKIDWHFQRGRLIETIKQWNVRDVLCELNSIGSPNLEALRREMHESPGNSPTLRGFQTTMKSKGDIIRALSLAIEKRNAFFLADEVGKHELISYEMTISESGNAKYSAVEGSHDDTVIARALAFDAAKRWYSVQPSAEVRINQQLPSTWTDSYLDNLNATDPVTAQRYYDARASKLRELKETIRNRPKPDYAGDVDYGNGRDAWTD